MKVSVVVPFFNAEKTIEAAVRSIVDQEFEDFEIIIVNDSRSTALETMFQDCHYVRLVSNPEANGAGNARRAGLREAFGDVIMMLDADDEWMPKSKKDQMDNMIANGCEISASPYLQFYVDNGSISLSKHYPYKKINRTDLLGGCWVGNSSLIFTKSINDLYQNSYEQRHAEDYDFLLTITKEHDIYYHSKVTYVYNVSSGSLSSNKLKNAIAVFTILLKHSNFKTVVFHYLRYIANGLKNAVLHRLGFKKTVLLFGGLGNNLFQLHLGRSLEARGFSVKYNDMLTKENCLTKLMSWKIHKSILFLDEQKTISPSLYQYAMLFLAFLEKKVGYTNWFWENANRKFIIGYFQTPRKLDANTVVDFSNHLNNAIGEFSECSEVVVHLRFGDAVWPQFHDRIMDIITDNYKQTELYVATDDQLRASELMSKHSIKSFNFGSGLEEDLYNLMNAPVVISGMSTFSFWAAALNINAEKIYVAKYFNSIELPHSTSREINYY